MKDLKKNRRKHSGLFRYFLLVEGLLVFSFVAAGLIISTVKEKPAPVFDSNSRFEHIFHHYKIITSFFYLQPGTQPNFDLNGLPITDNPFVNDILLLDSANSLKKEKKYPEMGTTLENIKTNDPYILHLRKPLYLKYLYSQGNYQEFINQWENRFTKGNDIELPLLLINCHLQARNDLEAFEIFMHIFPGKPIGPFLEYLPRQKLELFLRQVDNNTWFERFRFLLANNRYTEFNREKTYARLPQLTRLFEAEFAYNQKRYAQCRQLLDQVKDERLLPYKQKLSLKINIKEDKYSLDGIDQTLHTLGKDPTVYQETLYDLGAIFSAKGEMETSLTYLERYIYTVNFIAGLYTDTLRLESLPIHDSRYWTAVWRCAWFYYRKNEKTTAARYFEEGTHSPVPANRIASFYWLHRINQAVDPKLEQYPLSYYYIKSNPPVSSSHESLEAFMKRLNQPQSPGMALIIHRLKALVKYNLIDQVYRYINWIQENVKINPADKHTLTLIKAILYGQQDNFYLAFAAFRDGFDYYECVRLPRFLSAIAYPVKYRNLVEQYSREFKIDYLLILSLIRQESFFRADIVSPANAHGLMQLLLDTARSIALRQDKKIYREDLFNPGTNIQLGIEFFKLLLDHYKGKIYLALAAYNAGSNRVDKWIKQFGDAAEDEFIEMIPFSETRNYVKKILSNYYYYQFYYGEPPSKTRESL